MWPFEMKRNQTLDLRILLWLLMMASGIEEGGEAMVIGPASFQPISRDRLMTDNFLSGMRSGNVARDGVDDRGGRISSPGRPLPVPRAADFMATSNPAIGNLNFNNNNRGVKSTPGRFDSGMPFQEPQSYKPYSVYQPYGNKNFGNSFNAKNSNNNNNLNNNNNNSPFKNLFGTDIGQSNANSNTRLPTTATTTTNTNGFNGRSPITTNTATTTSNNNYNNNNNNNNNYNNNNNNHRLPPQQASSIAADFSPNGRHNNAQIIPGNKFNPGRNSMTSSYPFSSIRLTPISPTSGISDQQTPNYMNALSPSSPSSYYSETNNNNNKNNDFLARNHPLFSVDNRAQSFQHVNPFEKPIQRGAFPLPEVNEPITLDLSEDEQKRVLFLKQNKKLPPSRNFVDTLRSDPSSKNNYRFFPVNKDNNLNLNLPPLPPLPSEEKRNGNGNGNRFPQRNREDENSGKPNENENGNQIPQRNSEEERFGKRNGNGNRYHQRNREEENPRRRNPSSNADLDKNHEYDTDSNSRHSDAPATVISISNIDPGRSTPYSPESRPGYNRYKLENDDGDDDNHDDDDDDEGKIDKSDEFSFPPNVHAYPGGGGGGGGDNSNGESSDAYYEYDDDDDDDSYDIPQTQTPAQQNNNNNNDYRHNNPNNNYNQNDRNFNRNNNKQTFNRELNPQLDAGDSPRENRQGGQENEDYTALVRDNNGRRDDGGGRGGSERFENGRIPKQGNYDVTVVTDEKITKIPNNNNNNDDEEEEKYNQGAITPTAVTGNDPAVKRVVERTIDSKGEKVVSTETHLPTDHIGFILTDDIYDDVTPTITTTRATKADELPRPRSVVNPTLHPINNHQRPYNTLLNTDPNQHTTNTNTINTHQQTQPHVVSTHLGIPNETGRYSQSHLSEEEETSSPETSNKQITPDSNFETKPPSPLININPNSLVPDSITKPAPNIEDTEKSLPQNNIENPIRLDNVNGYKRDKPPPAVGSGYLRWPYLESYQDVPTEVQREEAIKDSSDSKSPRRDADEDVGENDFLPEESDSTKNQLHPHTINHDDLTQSHQNEVDPYANKYAYPNENDVTSSEEYPASTIRNEVADEYPSNPDQRFNSENEIGYNNGDLVPFENNDNPIQDDERTISYEGSERTDFDGRRDLNLNDIETVPSNYYGNVLDNNGPGNEILENGENHDNVGDEGLRLGIMSETDVSTHDKESIEIDRPLGDQEEVVVVEEEGEGPSLDSDQNGDGEGPKNKNIFSRETDDHEHINLDNLSEYLKETNENDHTYTKSDDVIENKPPIINNDENGIPNFNDYTYETFGKSGIPFIPEDAGEFDPDSESEENDEFSVNTDPISSKFDLLNAGEGSVSVRKFSNTFDDGNDDDDDDVEDDNKEGMKPGSQDDSVSNQNTAMSKDSDENQTTDVTSYNNTPDSSESGQDSSKTESFDDDDDVVVALSGQPQDGGMPDGGDSGDMDNPSETEEFPENETPDSNSDPSDKFFKPESSYDKYDFATPSGDGFSAQSAFIQSDLDSDSDNKSPISSSSGFSPQFDSFFGGKSKNQPETGSRGSGGRGSGGSSFRSLFQNINQDYLDSTNLGGKGKLQNRAGGGGKRFSGVFEGRDSLFDRQLGQIVESRPSLRLFS